MTLLRLLGGVSSELMYTVTVLSENVTPADVGRHDAG
jgi:hypothetical protein